MENTKTSKAMTSTTAFTFDLRILSHLQSLDCLHWNLPEKMGGKVASRHFVSTPLFSILYRRRVHSTRIYSTHVISDFVSLRLPAIQIPHKDIRQSHHVCVGTDVCSRTRNRHYTSEGDLGLGYDLSPLRSPSILVERRWRSRRLSL